MSRLEIKILEESGYEPAMLGLSLSYNQSIEHIEKVASRLALRDGGHNKFLESIVVWLEVNAPRYWWQQFDTYRVGVTKQSESTMHTLLRAPLTNSNFSSDIPNPILDILNELIIAERDLDRLKALLPEGFMQRRIVCTNYKTLRNILSQRRSHKLSEWQLFCSEIMKQISHTEFLADIMV